jgi:hypothetical protein
MVHSRTDARDRYTVQHLRMLTGIDVDVWRRVVTEPAWVTPIFFD